LNFTGLLNDVSVDADDGMPFVFLEVHEFVAVPGGNRPAAVLVPVEFDPPGVVVFLAVGGGGGIGFLRCGVLCGSEGDEREDADLVALNADGICFNWKPPKADGVLGDVLLHADVDGVGLIWTLNFANALLVDTSPSFVTVMSIAHATCRLTISR